MAGRGPVALQGRQETKAYHMIRIVPRPEFQRPKRTVKAAAQWGAGADSNSVSGFIMRTKEHDKEFVVYLNGAADTLNVFEQRLAAANVGEVLSLDPASDVLTMIHQFEGFIEEHIHSFVQGLACGLTCTGQGRKGRDGGSCDLEIGGTLGDSGRRGWGHCWGL